MHPYFSIVLHSFTLCFSSTHHHDASENDVPVDSEPSLRSQSSRESSLHHELPPSRSRKRTKKRSREFDEVEAAILSKLTADDHVCDAEEYFGLHVASVLRTLQPRQHALTKIEIDRLLFAAQFPEPMYRTAPYESYIHSSPTDYTNPTNSQNLSSPDPQSKFYLCH